MQKDFILNRFKSVQGYAPFTMGCPANTVSVDRSVFVRPDWQRYGWGNRQDMPQRNRPKLVTIFKGSF